MVNQFKCCRCDAVNEYCRAQCKQCNTVFIHYRIEKQGSMPKLLFKLPFKFKPSTQYGAMVSTVER